MIYFVWIVSLLWLGSLHIKTEKTVESAICLGGYFGYWILLLYFTFRLVLK